MGIFGESLSITDGQWTLHQPPDPAKPLYWYSHQLNRTSLGTELGPFADGRREVLKNPLPDDMLTTWLTNRSDDPAELINRADAHPEKRSEMKQALKQKLIDCRAPYELLDRFQLTILRLE